MPPVMDIRSASVSGRIRVLNQEGHLASPHGREGSGGQVSSARSIGANASLASAHASSFGRALPTGAEPLADLREGIRSGWRQPSGFAAGISGKHPAGSL